MKRYLPFIIIGVVALGTLGSGAILYRVKRPHLLTIPEDKIVSEKNNSESIHIRGNPEATVTLEEFGDFQCPPCGNFAGFIAVTLEEFGDFQCPPCGNFAGFIDGLVKEYDPRLRLVFRNFPLANHKHAREAALAAEAAGLQGRFWEMHDLLYREQAVWSNADSVPELFNGYAGMIGLNLDQFKKDMDGEKTKARVDSDHERGNSLGVQSTPTVFINNRQLAPNDRTPDGLRAIIDAALKEKS